MTLFLVTFLTFDICAGFLMADAGYDVWLGNMRGNTYGMAHVKYTTKQHEFWQFT